MLKKISLNVFNLLFVVLLVLFFGAVFKLKVGDGGLFEEIYVPRFENPELFAVGVVFSFVGLIYNSLLLCDIPLFVNKDNKEIKKVFFIIAIVYFVIWMIAGFTCYVYYSRIGVR